VQIKGELVEVGENYVPEPRAPMVYGDIKPYKSMIDGSEITSRSRHREHLRMHGCIEIGNETKYLQPKPLQSPAGLRETLRQATEEVLSRRR
jgi:hypothetical protein